MITRMLVLRLDRVRGYSSYHCLSIRKIDRLAFHVSSTETRALNISAEYDKFDHFGIVKL